MNEYGNTKDLYPALTRVPPDPAVYTCNQAPLKMKRKTIPEVDLVAAPFSMVVKHLLELTHYMTSQQSQEVLISLIEMFRPGLAEKLVALTRDPHRSSRLLTGNNSSQTIHVLAYEAYASTVEVAADCVMRSLDCHVIKPVDTGALLIPEPLKRKTRWWFQIFFSFSSLVGEDFHFDSILTNIFQMG